MNGLRKLLHNHIVHKEAKRRIPANAALYLALYEVPLEPLDYKEIEILKRKLNYLKGSNYVNNK